LGSVYARHGMGTTTPLAAKLLCPIEKFSGQPLTPRAHATYSAAKWDKVG
jgi:hypothetical protein